MFNIVYMDRIIFTNYNENWARTGFDVVRTIKMARRGWSAGLDKSRPKP